MLTEGIVKLRATCCANTPVTDSLDAEILRASWRVSVSIVSVLQIVMMVVIVNMEKSRTMKRYDDTWRCANQHHDNTTQPEVHFNATPTTH